MKKKNLTLEAAELIEGLKEGHYKSSIDLILEFTGGILQKISRRERLPAPWISALTISLLISLTSFLSTLFSGGLSSFEYQIIAFGAVLFFLNLILAKIALDRVFSTLGSKLLPNLESNTNIKGISNWLIAVRKLRRPVLIGLLVYITVILFILPVPEPGTLNLTVVVTGGTMLLWTGFIINYMILYMVLSQRLSRLDFKLHPEDPVSTELFTDWSGMMNLAAYLFAVMLATGTLFTVSTITFSSRALFFIIPRWLLLIALFIIDQMAMSQVITRSKRNSLTAVENMMAEIRPEGYHPGDPKLGKLMQLWDYHDRIKGTRNTVLNLNGVANFVSTLLIPLLAFLIANLTAVIELFS